MPDQRSRTVHLRIDGRVQGVGYRYWAADRANELQLTGWVRNRRDGAVEAVFSGPEAVVERMIALCREGPADAAVATVEIVGEGTGIFDAFTIERTV
jgi:acylphosphatase